MLCQVFVFALITRVKAGRVEEERTLRTGIWRARQLGVSHEFCSRWKVLSLKCK